MPLDRPTVAQRVLLTPARAERLAARGALPRLHPDGSDPGDDDRPVMGSAAAVCVLGAVAVILALVGRVLLAVGGAP